MRQVVMSDDYREAEVWPPNAFNRYLKLTAKEVKRLLADNDSLVDIPCPACNSAEKDTAFKKFGLEYVECTNCNTLYISPRPSEKAIIRYFQDSKAIEFWYSHVVKESLKARVGHLFRPRAMWVANVTGESFASPGTFIDVGSMYSEFLTEIDKLNLFKTKIALDPLINISETLEKMVKPINKSVSKLSTGEITADVVTAIAVIDRVFNPENFLEKIRNILVDRGLFFFTTSTISGFDLQVLWNKSKTIFPPDHINLLSIEGIVMLLERCGFEVIELSTPGQLDVEVVKNALKSDESLKMSRFISYLLKNRDENTHHSFQEFLQRSRLSSHVRVAARKK